MEIDEIKDALKKAYDDGHKYASVCACITASHNVIVTMEFSDEYGRGMVPVKFILSSSRRIKEFSELINSANEIARNINNLALKSIDCIREYIVHGEDYFEVSSFFTKKIVESKNQINSYAKAMCKRMLGRNDQHDICEIAAVESGSIELHAGESFGEIVREHLKIKKSIK